MFISLDTCINEIERVTVTSAAIQANEDTRGGRRIQSNRTKGRRRNKRSMKWGTINARSLGKKMLLLEKCVALHNLKIVSVTESWAKDDKGDGLYALKGYKMYRNDRNNKVGGGNNIVCRC